MPLIAIERGPEKGRTAAVKPDQEVIVGRDPEATLPISDSMSSRRHIRFFLDENGQCVVEDLGSRNGTSLNGELLEGPRPVTVGDKLEIGETLISVLGKSEGVTKDKLVDREIGGYRILERLGRGGMGTVYKANQLNLDRVVALKILSREWNDPGFVEKFRAEARAAGQLNHPNLIQVYDVGDVKLKNGTLNYFSMEYAGGGSVQDLLNMQQKLPLEQALRIMIDAARGLEYAAKKQLVHRDIKPDNLMISEGEMIKIGDLGLAQSTNAESEAGQESKIFGTPHFVSPEQIKGEKVDHRADLYSLGATFFRILTGRTPFLGDNVKEIIVKQVREQPPDVREIDAAIPRHVAEMIKKLMQKDPAERYQEAGALLADLQAAELGGDKAASSAVARLRSSGVPPGRAPRKKGFPLAAALGMLVLAIAGIVLANVLLGNGKPPEPNGNPDQNTNKTLPPAPNGSERRLKALMEMNALEEKYRGLAPTPEMAGEFGAAGEQFKDTPEGKKMLARAEQIRADWQKAREAQALALLDQAEQARKQAGSSMAELDQVKKLYQVLKEKFPGTEWERKADEALKQLETQLGDYKQQIAAYQQERKTLDPRIIELARDKRFGQVLAIVKKLRQKYTHREIASILEGELRSYRQEADRAFRQARDTADGHRKAQRFDQAIGALELIYRIGLPDMTAEADKLKQAYENERRQHQAQLAARQLAADSERYETLLDRLDGKALLGGYRIDDALEVAQGLAGEFETTEYKALHSGLVADIKALQRLFELRRDQFGAGVDYTLSAAQAASYPQFRAKGQLVSVGLYRGEWKFKCMVSLKGANPGTTQIAVRAAALEPQRVIELLLGQDDRSPKLPHRFASIGAANLRGHFPWAHTQMQKCAQFIAQGDTNNQALLKACRTRLLAIERHVAHEWRRAQAARAVDDAREALRIARRIKQRYGSLR